MQTQTTNANPVPAAPPAPSPRLLADDPAAACCGAGDADPADPQPTTLSTGDFLAAVRAAAPDQRLVFQLDGELLVDPGYHVTEVKAVTYDTMDCGGVAARWQETIVQLWNPGDEPESGHMAAGKFLAIYDRVAASVATSAAAELRFEYGDCTRPASAYPVEGLDRAGENLLVHLRSPVVACKARDREESEAAREGRPQQPRCCA